MTDEERYQKELDDMGDDLGIEYLDSDLQVAKNLNEARTASQQLLDQAAQRIRPRESIEGSDKANPVLVELNRRLSDQLELDIKNIPRTDPNYGKRVSDCYERYT